jgi:alpha-L-rhamnosidase
LGNSFYAMIAGIAILATSLGLGQRRSRVRKGHHWSHAGVLCALLLTAGIVWAAPEEEGAKWPEADATCKPWAYNWWMGSAVDKENLTKEFQRYRDAGLGGIHIIPIYGVKGADAREIQYLSPKWMEMLAFAVREGKRLGLGVDMTTGTGWCFGGPNVAPGLAG